jgi:hypothetical protein
MSLIDNDDTNFHAKNLKIAAFSRMQGAAVDDDDDEDDCSMNFDDSYTETDSSDDFFDSSSSEHDLAQSFQASLANVPSSTQVVGNGLFLSLEMVKLLRKSSSEGNIADMIPQCLLESMTPSPSKNPDHQSNETHRVSKHSSIVFAMQERNVKPKTNGTSTTEVQTSPKETITNILKKQGRDIHFVHCDNVPNNYFVKGTTSSYSTQLMAAVRAGDIETVRYLHDVKHYNLQCANKFQESIVHTVARRGYTDILMYLHSMAGVSLRVCCDGGRNALHDACWTGTPNFDVINIIVNDSPDLFYIMDKRNNSPLDYIPKEAYGAWNEWLHTNVHLLVPRVLP